MKQRRRIYYSETQKALMWERWRKDESRRKTVHPRPISPYPFGQIKHLAYKVEGNPRRLIYNYQVVGKHPVTRFSSLRRKPHTRSGGRTSTSARLYFNRRALVGSRKAPRFVCVPVC